MCRFCRTQNVWYCLTHKEFFQFKSKKKSNHILIVNGKKFRFLVHTKKWYDLKICEWLTFICLDW